MSVKNDLLLILAGAMVVAPTAASAETGTVEATRLEAAGKIVRETAGEVAAVQGHGPNVNDSGRNASNFKDWGNFRNWSDFRNFKNWSDW
jgi:hypothetical protein